ncbi:MAG TPA: hypothetical protein VN628_13470 [Vicinamibacterales bacterium]|nr:hypothetical protein [Vicinamibacterales bacterium]
MSAAPYTAPRAADGHADLSGVWENISATPLQRPAQFANTPLLSDAQLADLQRRAAKMFAPDQDAAFGDQFYTSLLNDANGGAAGAGTYSANWLPDRLIERRTSLITDPPDGKLPPFTGSYTAARAAAAAVRPRFIRGPEDMFVTDRCISYGVPDLFAAYMSVYRIFQSRDQVVITMEKIHDTRIIPLDGRPHISSKIRHYMGDPRGHWDGDTLVVETTNFHPNGNAMGGLFRFPDQNLTLTERFTRSGPDAVTYEFTVDDPTVWTRPWSAMVPWTRARGTSYEYACHEGNYSLRNMLSVARYEEAH